MNRIGFGQKMTFVKELSESGFRAHQLVESWAIWCAHLELSDSTFVRFTL